MGAYAYLELRAKRSLLNPFAGTKLLFSRKSEVPFAWHLFFSPDDFDQKSGALAVEISRALPHAKERLNALRPRATEQLMKLLDGFVTAIGARTGQLVLNATELALSQAALTAPAKWLASLEGKKLTRKALSAGERLFEDGIDWEAAEHDEDPHWLDLDDRHGVLGDANESKDHAWLRELEDADPLTEVRASGAELSAALAAVLETPDQIAPRLVYADLLTAAGDPRGEFIVLQCQAGNLSSKKLRRLEHLREELEYELGAPFQPAKVTFENGFAATASFAADPLIELANPTLWKTVHTVEVLGRGAARILTDVALHELRRAKISASDVQALVSAGRAVPFRSISVRAEGTEIPWSLFASRDVFPSLVEVHVESVSVWLPDGAKDLIERRPELNVRTRLGDPWQLQALTQEEQRARRARWDEPAKGAQLAGARFDDRYV